MKRVLAKKLSAAFLALVMLVSLVPAASAASVDKTYYVDEDDYVYLDAADFQNMYEAKTSRWEELEYIEFTSYDDFDDYGYFAFTDFDDYDYDDVDYQDLEDFYFYTDYQSTDATKDDIDLDTLEFVTYDNIDSATLDFTVKLHGSAETKTAYIRIDVEGSGYGSSSGNIDYEVRPGGSVDFYASDFNDVFQKEYPSYSVQYVEFDTPTSSDYAYGTVYYRYGKSGEDYFTRTGLDDYDFYYSSSAYGEYALDDLSFVADRNFEDYVELTFTAYGSGNRYVTGTVTITADDYAGSGSGDGDINYDADSGDKVTFKKNDFKSYYDASKGRNASSFSYVTFDYAENLDDNGKLYAYDYYDDDIRIYEDEIDAYYFYNSASGMEDDDTDLYLDGMYYKVDSSADDETVTLDFTVHGTSSRDKWDGTLTITIGNGGDGSSSSSEKGDINYKAEAGEETTIDSEDFNDYFRKTYSSYDIKYVTFTDAAGLSSANGAMYVDYGYRGQKKFSSASSLDGVYFYYDEDAYEEAYDNDEDCYLLDDLSFVAGSSFKTPVELEFTAYYSSSRKVTGTVVFGGEADTTKPIGTYYVGSVRYNTTPGTAVQIKAGDIAGFFRRSCPGFELQYVMLTGVPSNGSLWYNYYGASKYGSAKGQITALNASGQVFYASPTSTSQYALTELTYVPSGANYCAAIPFTAYGNGGRAVSGAILISVTSAAVGEVYSVTTKGTPVAFPENSIKSAVTAATGQAPASIQLLNLPAYTSGVVCVGSSYTAAKTTEHYGFGYTGSYAVSQLSFVPTTGFTGSVEVPYVALNSNGFAIASGVYSIGVVNAKKTFKDVSATTWCYKYVTELSDAKIIDGYTDGSFKPNSTITYGAALKLIMRAAGYPEQKPINSNVFSGYLAKAKADGLVSGNINLSKPITRLQVAQLAAKAMKLNTANLSTVKPFTDTSDPYVQALNAAGIIEGYFANGTSTYKPNNNLTRGQVSAIVWRMENYK